MGEKQIDLIGFVMTKFKRVSSIRKAKMAG